MSVIYKIDKKDGKGETVVSAETFWTEFPNGADSLYEMTISSDNFSFSVSPLTLRIDNQLRYTGCVMMDSAFLITEIYLKILLLEESIMKAQLLASCFNFLEMVPDIGYPVLTNNSFVKTVTLEDNQSYRVFLYNPNEMLCAFEDVFNQ